MIKLRYGMLDFPIKFKHLVTLNLIRHGKDNIYCFCFIGQYNHVFEYS